MGRLDLSHLLLMNNAALPWIILVPETSAVELCDLAPAVHTQLFDEVRAVSLFLRANVPVDKLNVAAIGNVTRQLHVHVIARRVDDYCWPGVPWGTAAPSHYSDGEYSELAARLGADQQLRERGYRPAPSR